MTSRARHGTALLRAAFEVAVGVLVIVVGVSLLSGDDAQFWHDSDTVEWMVVTFAILTTGVWRRTRVKPRTGRADACAPLRMGGSPLGRAATSYLGWLMDRRLNFPSFTPLNRQVLDQSRRLHQAAQAGKLDSADAGPYREEQRHVVTMTAIALMLLMVGLAAAADAFGFRNLNTPIIVLFSVVVGGHVMLLFWLAWPAQRSG
jgi:hypothetical protein